MTDPRDQLPPEQEQEVAALLASVAGPVSAPPDVVSRLDDVLAGLVAERTADAEPGPSSVVPLRRRRWPGALLAAAALVVGGFAVGNVADLTLGGGGDDSGADTASLDTGDAEGSSDGGPGAPEMDSGGALTRSRGDEAAAAAFVPRPDVRLDPARLDADLTALLGAPAPTALGADPEGTDESDRIQELAQECEVPPLREGDSWSLVTYGAEASSQRATVTLSAPAAGMITATVRSCASGEVLAQTRVSAPD